MLDSLNTITGNKIETLLAQAAAERCVMEITLPELDQPYLTRIHDISSDKKSLQIYTFEIGEVDRLMDPGTPLGVQMRIDKLPYRFLTRCSKNSHSLHYHYLDMPTSIEVIQRRAYFRLQPPTPRSVSAKIRFGEEGPLRKVEVVNLSVGGICVADKRLAEVRDFSQPATLILRFHGENEFQITATVRHSHNEGAPVSSTALGLKFEDLDPILEAALNRIVMEWQREICRSKRGIEVDRSQLRR